ncbi:MULTISPECIES: peptidase inhibitor family I36 protein [Streptomyces]|uniref:Peptidase inhibitor family I36 protein n=1 Tax=Streptomyces durocortorensis TaxID=2811104 RepID=A0ABS2HPV1_9ACTN|nr:peptidase inhibitor family I36 protein [Streptomyces durocortorensis]MBM7052735.1 peptidase inhibitor family I36 protein [Streptomyces durocortorensis]
MNWKKKSAAALSVLALAGSGMIMSAAPASAAPAASAPAAGDCPSARLCIYDDTNFNGDRITSASTNACFTPWNTIPFGSIRSYVSNSPVTAKVWRYGASGYTAVRTLPAGGFSSDIGAPVGGGPNDKVCLGSATP